MQHLAVKVNSTHRDVEEITGDHQCEFQHSRSSTDHIYCVHQILERKWEYTEAVQQLFIDFKKDYDSVRRDILYNIISECDIPMIQHG